MSNFTKMEKYAIINILSCIMKADGIIHPKEEEFMNRTYHDFGITVSDLEDIAILNDIQAKHIVCDMSDKKKRQAMLLCMEMAKADGFIHPKEIETIKQIFSL